MTSTEDAGERARVVELTQLVIAEADRVSKAFVGRHKMHATDMETLVLVLVATEHGQVVTPGMLGEDLGLTSGAITAVVDRLERSGYLQRVRDPHDRRRVLLQNSPAGHKLASHYFQPVKQRTEAVLDEFTGEELKIIGRYLSATANAMATHRQTLTAPHP